MKSNPRNSLFLLLACVGIIAVGVGMARLIQTDSGRVEVTLVSMPDPSGVTLFGNLYRPVTATPDNPLPAVLALHGFIGEKESLCSYAIELSRRGFVVLALEEFGHGSSGGRLGPPPGKDPTLGGNTGYRYLKSLPYVDVSNLGVMGHSMGAFATVEVGKANPDHKALNPLCGTPGAPELHNVLLTQARFEEFSAMREAQNDVRSLTTNANRLKAFGRTGSMEWNTTYGSFADGTARRQALINTVHQGVSHDAHSVAETLTWFRQSLKQGRTDANWIDPTQQIFMRKEYCTLFALLAALVSMIPLTNLLLRLNFFTAVAQPMPTRYVVSTGDWWKAAIVNNLIVFLTYPTLAGVGAFLLASLLPGSLLVGNGFLLWFLGNTMICLLLFKFWYRKHQRTGVNLYDLGLSFDQASTRLDWGIIGKTALLGFLLLGWLYGLVAISQRTTGIEFHFIWPFMREFSAIRFGFFWVYLLPALAFFLVNGGIFLFGQMHQKEYENSAKTQVIWWLKNCAAAWGGLLLIWMLQYLPFFFGLGPGFSLIGLPILGEGIPLLLFGSLPEFILLSFFLTWFYRRTGKVYLGALVIASLVIWWLTAGTSI